MERDGKTSDRDGKTIDKNGKTIDRVGKTIDRVGKTIDRVGKKRKALKVAWLANNNWAQGGRVKEKEWKKSDTEQKKKGRKRRCITCESTKKEKG